MGATSIVVLSRALPALAACLLLAVLPVVDVAPASATLVSDPCGGPVVGSDGTEWQCSFADDFDGAGLDRTKWLPVRTAVNGMTGGERSCYVDRRRNIKVRHGRLLLSALQVATPFVCHSPAGDFTTTHSSASVTSRGHFSQAYGRFEFRAKMALIDGPGAHSALWLYPNRQTYGAWPRSGEIDVAEWYSAIPQQVYPSLHYVDGRDDVVTGQDGEVHSAGRFHTYAVDWTPTTMRFYYDGALTFEHAWAANARMEGSQPFDQPFNVVLTQMWGGDWNAPTAGAPQRVTMKVDWVRAWSPQS